MSVAAWVPFLDPINVFQDWWYLLLLPLSFGIAMIYRALKMENLDRYWRAVGTMTVQIVLGMIGLAVVLVILVQLVIPRLPAG